MKWPIILVLALLGGGSRPQADDSEKWNTVERMCGKLEWLEEIPVKGTTDTFNEKRMPVKKAEVRLYRRENDSPCCGATLFVTNAVTNRAGEFEFKKAVPGRYWIVAIVDGKEYSHAIKFAPESKDKVEVSCSDLLYDVHKGELQLGRVIHCD